MGWLSDSEVFPTLTITFPRSVRIENTRLAILYWILVAAAISLVVYNYYQAEGYFVKLMPAGDHHFWVTNWRMGNDGSLQEVNAKEDDAVYCKAPDQFSFCDTADCSEWSAIQMQCVDLCTESVVSDCLETGERWVKDSNSLFFPTFFHEIDYIRETDGKGAVTGRTQTEKWRIVKGVTDMGIGFDHEYTVMTPDYEEKMDSNRAKGSKLLAVLNNQAGVEIARWEPGKSVSLSLTRILEVAGVDLDQVEPELGQNFLEGAKHPEGIARRLAGVKVWVDVAYYNRFTHSVEWDGPVAVIRIKNTVSPAWVSRPTLEVLDSKGSKRLRYYHGIQIEFSSSGSFAWISPDKVIGLITSILVFMGVAKKLMFFFSIRCLGIISRVYKGFLFQQCSVSQECIALATRLCSHTSTFVELKDESGYISQPRILRRLRRIFAPFEHILDQAEIERLGMFVFGGIRKYQHCGNQEITVDGFSQACSHGEPLQLKTMISIFDANRSKNLLERVFAGPDLKKLFSGDKMMVRGQSLIGVDQIPMDSSSYSSSPSAAHANPLQQLSEAHEAPAEKLDLTAEAPDFSGTGQNAGSGEPRSTNRLEEWVENEIIAVKKAFDTLSHNLEKELHELRAMAGVKEGKQLRDQEPLLKDLEPYAPALSTDVPSTEGGGSQHHKQTGISKSDAQVTGDSVMVQIDEKLVPPASSEVSRIYSTREDSSSPHPTHNTVTVLKQQQQQEHKPTAEDDDEVPTARSVIEGSSPKDKNGKPRTPGTSSNTDAKQPEPNKDSMCCMR